MSSVETLLINCSCLDDDSKSRQRILTECLARGNLDEKNTLLSECLLKAQPNDYGYLGGLFPGVGDQPSLNGVCADSNSVFNQKELATLEEILIGLN